MAVCANGAVIYDPSTDRIISARTLSADVLGELAEIATRVIPGAGLAVERVGPQRARRRDPAVRQLAGLRARLAQPGQHRGVDRRSAQRARGQAADPQGRRAAARTWRPNWPRTSDSQGDITYSTNNGLIEIMPLGISKATGVEEVARPLGITAEDVVTFGDMPNDVPMLRWAGLGVAMGNAHPDAVAAADEVTATNADDGVARVLERWWL